MDQPRRLRREEVVRILEASGVRHLPREAGYNDRLRAVVMCARLVQHAPINDVALVYAAVVDFFEARSEEAPHVTEQLFFDPITREMYGTRSNEGEAPGEGVGAVVQGGPGLQGEAGLEEPGGEQGGSNRRRPSRVEISIPARDRGEESQESPAVGGPPSGGRRRELPF